LAFALLVSCTSWQLALFFNYPMAMTITIRVKRNGPYVIALEEAENVMILDSDGNSLVPEAGKSIALCRCGGSATKPFCDRTHRNIGFCDPAAPSPAAPSSPT
jgi:3-phenylpropionate/trans-cinnamate dioxygenase ferredoxin subunit